MTNRIIIDSDSKIDQSIITLTGDQVNLANVMFPVSLELTYRDREFYLTELQDRIRPDGLGVVLAKFKPNDDVTTKGGLNGLQIHVMHNQPDVFDYTGTGITREIRSMGDLLKGSPYYSLGEDLVVEPTEAAVESFRFIFGNLKPTIEQYMNSTNRQGLYKGKETIESFMTRRYDVEATQVNVAEQRFSQDGGRNKLELELGMSEEEGTAFREGLREECSEDFEIVIPGDKYEEEYAFDALRRYYDENGFKVASKLIESRIQNGFVLSCLFQHRQRLDDLEFATAVVQQQSRESPATVRFNVRPKDYQG